MLLSISLSFLSFKSRRYLVVKTHGYQPRSQQVTSGLSLDGFPVSFLGSSEPLVIVETSWNRRRKGPLFLY